MLFLIWTAVLLAVVYLYFRNVYSRFTSQGVNCPPLVPFVGNMGKILFGKEHLFTTFNKAYTMFPDNTVIGFYEFLEPTYVIKDVELLKKVTVKDFEHFVDRRSFAADFQDPLFTKTVLLLKGDEWKAMRSALSPAFTSSKIRLMVPFMLEVGDLMINHLRKKINESKVDYVDVDVKDLCSRYANDVIATCGFGLKVDSSEKDNQFYINCREVTEFSLGSFVKLIFIRILPRLSKMLDVTITDKSMSKFFTEIVLGTIKQREEQNVIRNDMIHLLMEAKKGNLKHDQKESNEKDTGFATAEESNIGKRNTNYEWTDEYVVSQVFMFLLAGFETVSTAMTFLLYEMALNPDMQERLYQEIKENNDSNNGKFDYNSIQRMKYLDMVVSESLRLWSPVGSMDRMCVKEYNLGKPYPNAKKDIILRKGDVVTLPFYSFHRDPKHFPEPDKFDPERFNDTNKHNIKPFTYLPFGAGPRNCIGSRFALCEVKIMAYQILLNMEVSPCEKTCIPAKLAKDSFQLRMEGGHWLRFKSRH